MREEDDFFDAVFLLELFFALLLLRALPDFFAAVFFVLLDLFFVAFFVAMTILPRSQMFSRFVTVVWHEATRIENADKKIARCDRKSAAGDDVSV